MLEVVAYVKRFHSIAYCFSPNKSAIMYEVPEYFDKTFNNVLEHENVEEQNCTGQKCKDCLACYKFNDVNVIVEKVKKY